MLELPAAGHIVRGAVSLGVSDKGVYERGGVRNGGGGTDADSDAASDSPTPSGWSMTLSSWPSTELSNEARFMAKAVARPELTASRPSVALLT